MSQEFPRSYPGQPHWSAREKNAIVELVLRQIEFDPQFFFSQEVRGGLFVSMQGSRLQRAFDVLSVNHKDITIASGPLVHAGAGPTRVVPERTVAVDGDPVWIVVRHNRLNYQGAFFDFVSGPANDPPDSVGNIVLLPLHRFVVQGVSYRQTHDWRDGLFMDTPTA